MGIACIDRVTKIGADATYPKNTMTVTALKRDAPAVVRMQFFERDSQKTTLPSEAPTRRPGDPIRGGTHQERNLITYLTHAK